jgi:hypothetical protein
MERSADLVRISGAGTAGSEDAASAALCTQIERLCGTTAPAALRPVTLDVHAMQTAATSTEGLHRFLHTQGLEADRAQMLALAADPERSAQASIVAIQSGVAGRPSRAHVEPTVVTIIDTPQGRLVAEHTYSGGKKWMIIAPGSRSNVAAALNRLVRRLPADQEWYSYRKVV